MQATTCPIQDGPAEQLRAMIDVAPMGTSDILTVEDVATHIRDIRDDGEIFVLNDRLRQYDLIPRRPEDFARWR